MLKKLDKMEKCRKVLNSSSQVNLKNIKCHSSIKNTMSEIKLLDRQTSELNGDINKQVDLKTTVKSIQCEEQRKKLEKKKKLQRPLR